MAQTITAFQVFRAAAVATVVTSTSLDTTVSGGLLRSTRQAVPGTTTGVTTTATCL